MAYQATVIPVMIASPGDVAQERDIIRKTIARWNAANSWNSRVILDPVGFDTHMAPGFGRPQQRINDQLLPICDLLIAVFWTKLGSPTGEEDSGTIEEIKAHIKAEKPAMIYFSSKPVSPITIDEEQSKKVKAFRTSLQPVAQYQVYDDLPQFETMLTAHLEMTLARDEHLRAVIAAGKVAENNSREMSQPTVLPAPRVAKVGIPLVGAGEFALLSPDARLVLAEAVQGQGAIQLTRYVLGGALQIGVTNLPLGDERAIARWQAAIDEAMVAGLIDRVGNGMYRLTHRGWERGDQEAQSAIQKELQEDS